jgi:hypothetical protein
MNNEENHSLILLSADNNALYHNRTIRSQVKVDLLRKFYYKPEKIKIQSKISVWGLNPTKDNEKIWNEIKPLDIVLFYRKGKFFSKGYIVDKFRNRDIPSKLWDNVLFGNAWEYIILIDKLVPINIDFTYALPFFVRPTMLIISPILTKDDIQALKESANLQNVIQKAI